MNKYRGVEFDWFAKDQNDQIGLFSTAGYGPIPEVVITQGELHNSISSKFETPNQGSENIWLDFAAYGLYVFDWQTHDGPYLKEASPAKVIDPSLREQILSIPDIPVLDIVFDSTAEVEIT